MFYIYLIKCKDGNGSVVMWGVLSATFTVIFMNSV